MWAIDTIYKIISKPDVDRFGADVGKNDIAALTAIRTATTIVMITITL